MGQDRLHRVGRTPAKIKPWYERDKGVRLAHDKQLVAVDYPGLSHRMDTENEKVFLDGSITLGSTCGVSTTIGVRVDLPRAYPKAEPSVYDIKNRFPHVPDRHFFRDGRCCLWLNPESGWDSLDPDALRTFLDHVAIFFEKQLICEATPGHNWPGPARSHEYLGYIEFVKDLLGGERDLLVAFSPIFSGRNSTGRNAECPCGRRMKFKNCHWGVIKDIERRVGSVVARQVFRRFIEKQTRP